MNQPKSLSGQMLPVRPMPRTPPLADLPRLLRIQESFHAFLKELQATQAAIEPALRGRLIDIDRELTAQLLEILRMTASIGHSHTPTRATDAPGSTPPRNLPTDPGRLRIGP